MVPAGPGSPSAIRVVIVDPHSMVARGLANALGQYHDLEVVAMATSLTEGIALTQEFEPALMLLEHQAQARDAVKAIATVRRSTPSTAMTKHRARREREVLTLLDRGLGVGRIASELGITRNPARNYVQAVLTKLGAHSQLEALAIARREGLLPGAR